MKAALYIRVSTNEQSHQMQLEELCRYCAARKWESHVYIEQAISGSKERRPALDLLWQDCRQRKIDAVVVYRYDRFARSLRQLVNALEEFRALGIEFVSLHEGVDTSTPNGRLIFGIFASIAEFERELIRDRVRSGMAAAKTRGIRIGRPKTCVNTSQIARFRRQGLSWAQIAQRMGISIGTAYSRGQEASN